MLLNATNGLPTTLNQTIKSTAPEIIEAVLRRRALIVNLKSARCLCDYQTGLMTESPRIDKPVFLFTPFFLYVIETSHQPQTSEQSSDVSSIQPKALTHDAVDFRSRDSEGTTSFYSHKLSCPDCRINRVTTNTQGCSKLSRAQS